MKIRAVLFDLDGTLTNSAPLIKEVCAQVMRNRSGRDCTPADFSSFVGPPLDEGFATLGVPADEIDDYIQDYRVGYFAVMDETPLFPGIAQMLAAVQDSGLHLATATSKNEASARHVCELTKIAPYFDTICGAVLELGRSHKHHVVGEALRRLTDAGVLDKAQALPEMELGTDWHERPLRSDVVMVGDRNFDTYGAAVHGVRTILVDWGEGSRAEKEYAWRQVSTVSELQDLLLSL